VAAITFTEKAAGELRVRIRNRMAERLAELERVGDADPEGQARLRAAEARLDRATITTIHSFCGQVLRERPIEAGVTPGFGVADEVTARALFEEAWDDWLAAELADLDSPLAPVLEAGVRTQDLANLVREMLVHRDALADPDAVLTPVADAEAGAGRAWDVFRDAVAALDAGIDGLLAACRKPGEDKAHVPMSAARAAIARLARRVAPGSGVPAHRLLGPLPFRKPGRGRKGDWDGDCLARLRELAGTAEEAHAAWAECHRSMLALLAVRRLRGALDAYARIKAERSLLDFEDLLLVTRDLLRKDPAARRDLAGTWTRLLVDEFQDTDPVQVEIVCLLAAAGEVDVAGALPPAGAGALFVVGDPKQSIYRFRRADIQMYQRTVRAMTETGSVQEVITANFRTRPSIINWVNRLFERLMPADEAGDHQPRYEAMEPFRDEPPGDGGGVIRLAIDARAEPDDDGKVRDLKAAGRRRAEARGVAAWLAREIGGGERTIVDRDSGEVRRLRWSDAAILFRTSTSVDAYEDALRRAEIPYRVEGGRFYFKRQEVQALLATLRAIDEPGNRVEMVAALRSVLFGFTDDELVLAADAGLFEPGGPRETPPPGIRAAAAWIRERHARRHVEGPGRMVESVLAATQAVELFALRPLGEQRVANLRKIVDEARRFEGHAGGFREFIRFLSEREAALEKEHDSPLVEDGAAGAVTLQTMHGAKGLEYGIVVLADLDGVAAGGRDDAHLKRDADGRVTLGFRLAGFPGGGGKTPGWEALEAEEARHAEAERKRLFYVAVTRARDRLVLPIAERDGKAVGLRALLSPGDLDDLPVEHPPADGVPDDEPLLRRGWRVPAPTDDGAREATLEVNAARAAHRDRLSAITAAWPPAVRWLNPSLAGGAGRGKGDETATIEAPVEPGPDGRPVGRAVHAALEGMAADGRDRERRVARAAASEGIDDPAERARVARLVDTALAHPLWKRGTVAARTAREVPVLAGWPAEDAGGVARCIDGTCDLLFEEEGGLVLVDWKSDRAEAGGWGVAATRHRAQLLGYLLAIEAGARQPVRELHLVFLEDGATETIRVDEAVRAEARRLYLGGA
jgi:ATP-dependent exoDNAse (exonuclease V) beta subunit